MLSVDKRPGMRWMAIVFARQKAEDPPRNGWRYGGSETEVVTWAYSQSSSYPWFQVSYDNRVVGGVRNSRQEKQERGIA